MSEHAVIINFQYGSTDFDPLFSLEDEIEKAIESNRVGEFDGDEIAVDGSDGRLYMYGSDADALFAVVKPILESSHFMKNAIAQLRYGPPEDGVREIIVKIT